MSFFTMIISFLHKFCMKYERLLLPICKDIHHLSVRRIFCVCLYTTARKARPSWPFLNGLFSRGSTIFGISTIRTHFYYFFLLLLRLFVYNRIVNTSFLVSSSWTKGVGYSCLQNNKVCCFTEMKDLEIATAWNGKERTNLYVCMHSAKNRSET